MERFGPTRRGGPVFRWLGEPLAIDLANTVMVLREDETVDLLRNRSELQTWLEAEHERLGDCASAVDQLETIHALRAAIRAAFAAVASNQVPPSQATDHLNAVSRRAPIAPQLVSDGRLAVASAFCGGEALDRLLAQLAHSAIEIASGGAEPLKICPAPSCGMFFLGARRWCCRACGNRARVARHYARARSAATRSE